MVGRTTRSYARIFLPTQGIRIGQCNSARLLPVIPRLTFPAIED